MFGGLLETILLFLMLMIPGWILGKSKLLSDAALPGLGNIVMYVAMPALVFVKLLQTDLSLLSVSDVLCCVCFPIVMVAMLSAISGTLFGKYTHSDHSVSIVCSTFPNCGFWSIPLACAMFPDRPEVAIYVSLFNVTSSALLLTKGIHFLSGDNRSSSLRRLLCNPILFAIIGGALFASVGLRMPLLESFPEQLSSLATPLSMIVLGAEAAKMKPGELLSDPRLYLAGLIKLVISPLLAIGILLLLRNSLQLPVSAAVCDAIFLATAVSTALSVPTMAAAYHRNTKYASVLTIGTTLMCALTMPLMYQVYRIFF